MKKTRLNILVVLCFFTFQISLGQDCPHTVTSQQSHTFSSEISAESEIVSSESIINPDINVEFIAGDLITLGDGFVAMENSNFRAVNNNGNCNDCESAIFSNGDGICETISFEIVHPDGFPEVNNLKFCPPEDYRPQTPTESTQYVVIKPRDPSFLPVHQDIRWESEVYVNVPTGNEGEYMVYINKSTCAPPNGDGNNVNCDAENNIAVTSIRSFTMTHTQNQFLSQSLPDTGSEEKRYYLEFDATLTGTITATSAVRIGIGFDSAGYNESRIDIAHESIRSIEITIPPNSTDVKLFAWRPSDPIPGANIDNNTNLVATITNLCLTEITNSGNETGVCTNTLIQGYTFGNTSAGDQWRTVVSNVTLEPGHNYQLTVKADLTNGGTAEVGLKTNTEVDGVWFKKFVTIDNSTNFTPLSVDFTATPNLETADLYVFKPVESSSIEILDVCLMDLTVGSDITDITTLKDYPTPTQQACGMYMGAAATTLYSDTQPEKDNYTNTFKGNFNLIVPEIGMKMEFLKPDQGSINATNGALNKEMQDIANKTDNPSNNMLVRGHTLCWHGSDLPGVTRGSRNPDYLNSMTAEALETELEGYIQEVVNEMESRFNIESWDVVNEALRGVDPNINLSTTDYRSPFRTADAHDPPDSQDFVAWHNGITCVWEKMGYSNISFDQDGATHNIPNYIVTAFQQAANHSNKPLVYNDWGAEFDNTFGNKSMYQFKMIEALKDGGVRIDGVGFQCHFTMNSDADNEITSDRINNFKSVIQRYTQEWSDIKIYFTEVDITLPENPTDNDRLEQARLYKELVAMAASIPQTEAFVTWGMYDQASWRQNLDGGEPLLFTKDGSSFERKIAYYEVLNALSSANCNTPNSTCASNSRNNANNNNIMEIGTNFNFLNASNPANTNAVFAFNNDPILEVSNGTIVGNPWNATFLQDVDLYKTYRFLNWSATNNNTRETHWQNRVLLTEPNQHITFRIAGEEVPLAWEWIIDLMNKKSATGQKDMWINIPHQTVGVDGSGNLLLNEYAHKLAILLKHGVDMGSTDLKSSLNITDYCELVNKTTDDFKNAAGLPSNSNTINLDPNIKIYVEYSNEIWNRGFVQTTYAQDEGFTKMFNQFNLGDVTDNSPNQSHRKEIAMQKFSAFGHINTWKSFLDVFGYNSDRIIKVIGHQAVESGYYLGKKAEVFNDPSLNQKGLTPDYIAIAPYFGLVKKTLPDGQGGTFTSNTSLDGSDTGIWGTATGPEVQTIANSIAELTVAVDNLKDAAQTHFAGVEFIAYEGGQHIINNCQIANTDGRMENAYTNYLNVLSSRLELFMNFTHAGIFSLDGVNCWGTVPNNGDLNHPKRRAIENFINGLPGTKLGNISNTTNFQIYPNPFTEQFTLETEAGEGQLRVVDMVGKILLQQVVTDKAISIDTKTLQPGYYLVEFEQNGNTQTQKIIKH